MSNKQNCTLKELLNQAVVLDLELSRLGREISRSTSKHITKPLLLKRNETANLIDEVLRKAMKRNSELR